MCETSINNNYEILPDSYQKASGTIIIILGRALSEGMWFRFHSMIAPLLARSTSSRRPLRALPLLDRTNVAYYLS